MPAERSRQLDLLEEPFLEGEQLDLDRTQEASPLGFGDVSSFRGTRRDRTERSRRSPSTTRRRRSSSPRRRDCARPTPARSTRVRSPSPSASGWTIRCTRSSSRSVGGRATPSRAAAWTAVSYETLISAPSAASSSSARSSVLFVYVVVTSRSRLAVPTVTSERIEHRIDSAQPNEGHHDVDRVGRVDLGAQLVTDGRLAARVRQERGVEQRCQRCFEHVGRSVGPAPQDRRTARGGIERNVDVRSTASLCSESSSISFSTMLAPAWARPSSGSASMARVTTVARWRDSRSAASASASLRSSGATAAATRLGQPLVERARKERFVEPRLEFVFRHRARVWPRLSANDGSPMGVP